MLVPFEPSHAREVIDWAQDATELAYWAALDARPDPSVFARWHADDDISAFVLLENGAPVAYGECWDEPAEASVELARILVSPSRRRRGVGVRLVESLMETCAPKTFWVRVVPDNAPALRLYESVGFVRAAESAQRRFNAGQPRTYTWLTL